MDLIKRSTVIEVYDTRDVHRRLGGMMLRMWTALICPKRVHRFGTDGRRKLRGGGWLTYVHLENVWMYVKLMCVCACVCGCTESFTVVCSRVYCSSCRTSITPLHVHLWLKTHLFGKSFPSLTATYHQGCLRGPGSDQFYADHCLFFVLSFSLTVCDGSMR